MTYTAQNKNFMLAAALVLFAVLSRIINIEYGIWLNFTCLGAISLFSGAAFRRKSYSFLLPLAAYLLSDLYIQFFTPMQGFYGISQWFTYGAMALIVLLGTTMHRVTALRVFGYSLGASAIFFIVSNFGVWFGNLFTGFEPGLTLGFTYLRALPFYNDFAKEMLAGTVVGDLVYSTLLFGAYALLAKPAKAVVA